jgi:hypothetical protein
VRGAYAAGKVVPSGSEVPALAHQHRAALARPAAAQKDIQLKV